MNITNHFYYFQSAIPKNICDDIVEYGLAHKEQLGLIGDVEKKLKPGDKMNNLLMNDLKSKRDSNVVFLTDTWIYRQVHPYVMEANNKAGWNFEWDWSEPAQFTKYKLNQYYDWHCDSWDKPYSRDYKDVPYRNKIRKLSVTCQLTDGSEYEGGELEFDTSTPENPNRILECKKILPKGSIVVFPSFVWHRVKPVTKGVRYSLVMWNLGYPFK